VAGTQQRALLLVLLVPVPVPVLPVPVPVLPVPVPVPVPHSVPGRALPAFARQRARQRK